MKSSVASGLDTSLVLSLHPFSFAAQAPAGHGTRGGKRQADMLLPWTWPLPDMSRSVHSSFTVASHPTCSQQRLLYPYVRATHGLLPTLYSGQLLGPCCCCCCCYSVWACKSCVRAADLLVEAGQPACSHVCMCRVDR